MEKLKLVPIYSTNGFETPNSVVAQGQVCAGIIESLLINKNQKTMKKYALIIISIIIGTILLSCTKDNNELDKTLTNIEGTIKGAVSCHTDGKGLAYGIVPENFELSSGFIITATLPDEAKQEGIRIRFDMKPSDKYITLCTANFFPEQFYEVFNVTILNDQQ